MYHQRKYSFVRRASLPEIAGLNFLWVCFACTGIAASNSPEEPPPIGGEGGAGGAGGSTADEQPIEPPLNADPATGMVPARRCPLYEDRVCPEDCVPIEAAPLNFDHSCWGERLVVDCSFKGIPFSDAIGCHVDPDNGGIYQTSILWLPAYARECTDEESNLMHSVHEVCLP